MSDYGSLTSTVGSLKRYAIDAYMADEYLYGVDGINHDTYALFGWWPLNTYERPAANGSGGGKIHNRYTGTEESPYVDTSEILQDIGSEFDTIRTRIDTTLSGWLDLPDGSGCSGPASASAGAARAFGMSGTTTSVGVSGDIAFRNAQISTTVNSQINGSFTTPFLDKYNAHFNLVAEGLGGASSVIEMLYTTQTRLWPAAQKDVAAIVTATRDSLKTHAADKSAANTRLGLSIVTAVVGAVAAIASGGAALPVAIAGITAVVNGGMDIMRSAMEVDAITGGDYDEILTSMATALTEVDATITAAESTLHDAAQSAITTMSAPETLRDFDLDAYPIVTYPTSGGTITMTVSARDSVLQNMKVISDDIAGAITKLGAAPTADPTPRSSGIGLSGPTIHGKLVELYSLTARCLTLTSEEYLRGRSLFSASADDFFDADAAARAMLARLAAEEEATAEL